MSVSPQETMVEVLHDELIEEKSPPLPHQDAPNSQPSTEVPNGQVTLNPAGPIKPSLLSRVWKSLGFNPTVIMIMVKSAVAATIAMSIYQKLTVAENYYNFGYLIIIVSVTTIPILPRGKFLMNLFVSVFLTCFAAAMVILGQYAGLKARKHSNPAGASVALASGYNSSASVVNAIFLMLNIFLITVLRAARPVFGVPSIQYTVFVMVGFTYGPLQSTQAGSYHMVQELLYAFLTGQAISAGVSLFIIPVSSRKVFFAEATGYLQVCRKLLRAQIGFVGVLEHSSLCSPFAKNNVKDENKKTYIQKAAILKAVSDALLSLAAKLEGDVIFAKRELALGNLRETDNQEFYKLVTDITYPISGLSTIAEISERMHDLYPAGAEVSTGKKDSPPQAALDVERQEWWILVQSITVPFEEIVNILDESILHILILLRLIPGPKKTNSHDANGNAEKGSSRPKAGDEGFGDYLSQRIEASRLERTVDVKRWAEERGLYSVFESTTKNKMLAPDISRTSMDPRAVEREQLASRRLHVVLYMEFLLYSVAKAILALVRFAEEKNADTTFKRKRLVVPALRTLVKWIKGLWSGDEVNNEETFDRIASNAPTVYLGDSFQRAKDPEHLPPKNRRQAWGDKLRIVPRLLGSAPVAFGVRVSIAVMSVGILAYLEKTHEFFIKQRVVWSLVMTSIGMSPTTGSAVFSLFWSLIFTALGMVGAFVNWYIADQQTTAVIVVFFLMLMIYFYFCARFPRFLVPLVAGALTHVLTIGYELQVRVIGLEKATITGQPYYPLYELAPYRLLTVAAGLIIAYIFTIFSVPITESYVFRRNLGNSVFLLAKYTSSITATVDFRLSLKEGDTSLPSSPGYQLAQIRTKTLRKQIGLLNSMKQNLGFLDWEPRLGGDFPKSIYKKLVDEVESVTNYLTIIAYASSSFPQSHTSSPWLSHFAASRPHTDHAAYALTSLFALLSSSILNAQLLPPYLAAPTDLRLSDSLISEKSHNVLSLSNLNELGFRAIAVIEVAQRCLTRSVDEIVSCVRELVGEMDFSYRVEEGNGKEKLV